MELASSLFIIFSIIVFGAICGFKKIFNNVHLDGFELFLFKIATPCYLFGKIANSNFFEVVNIDYLLSYTVVFIIVVIMGYIYFAREHDIEKICIMILASGYVNAAIYNIPIITILLGDPSAAVIGNILQVVVFQSVFIIILYHIKYKNESITNKIMKSITTPLVILPLLGVLISYSTIRLPHAIILMFENIGASAASMALFVLGLNMSKSQIKLNNIDKNIVYILLTKNILHPVIAFLIGKYLFNLRGYWLNALIISTAAPTAFLVYLIAKKFDVEVKLIRNIITQSMIISLLTLSLIVAFISTHS